MNNKTFVLATMRKYGEATAQDLQKKAPTLTGTELIAQEEFLPDFDPSRQYLNYKAGYVCKSSVGNAVKLLQPYDSTVYTGQPESLAAQWGFYWSKDPKKAKPFAAISTSPYMTGDCCVHNGRVWRSGQDNNVWEPGANKAYDVLKWIALYLLPAAGTLYFALSTIWGLPNGEQVVGTITAIDAFLGAVLGISTLNYKKSGSR